MLDTRGRNGDGPIPGSGTTLRIPVRGDHGVPASATAVAVQVTAAEGTGTGWLAVMPSGSTPGQSANVNVDVPGEEISNLAVVPLGHDGSIEVFTHAPTHVVVDLVGWWSPVVEAVSAGRFESNETATRLLDTRVDPTRSKAVTGGTITLDVTGRAGVPASGVTAVVVNIAATDTEGPGFVQAGPASTLRPGRTATLNVDAAGQTVSSAAVVPVDADGRIAIYTQRGANVVVDVTGWFTDATAQPSTRGLFVPNERVTRVLDTRQLGAPLHAGGEISVPVAGSAAVGNIAVTDPAAPGWVQLAPGSGLVPGATANINTPGPGGVLSNAFLVPADGTIRAHTYSQTHVVVDVAGHMT